MAVFRVERNKGYTVMSNYHLKDRGLTLKSKGLLSMMLSLPDEWNYTTRGLAAICKEGVDSIGAALRELEKAKYIVRNQLRDTKGRITDTEYVIYEQPHAASPDTDHPDTENPYMDKPDVVTPYTGGPYTENPAQLNTKVIKTNLSNTQISNTEVSTIHPSIYPRPDAAARENRMDGMDTMEAYRRLILENIEYDYLLEQYGQERMGEILELMLEAVCTPRAYIRIGGEDIPAEVVKSRLLKLNSTHIHYIFECLDKNISKVRNIKGYLLTTLYNAPNTIDHYYRAEVNHDMYGGPD
jgi:hypothetical protein